MSYDRWSSYVLQFTLYLLINGFVLIDTIMIGHLGKSNLTALIIGYAYYSMLWYFILGFMNPLFNFSKQSMVIGTLDNNKTFIINLYQFSV